MRTALLSLALFFSADALACPMADAAAYAAAAAEIQSMEGSKMAFNIPGLSCSKTSQKMTSTLKGMEGVFAAAVDYQTGEAVVAFDSSKTDKSKLLAVFSDIGYSAETKSES